MRKRQGMTLLEVVVALWVLFLVIVMAAAILQRSLRHSREQEHTTRAAFLASQKMEDALLLSPRQLLASNGAFDAPFNDYTWKLRAQSLAGEDFFVVTVTVAGPAGAFYELHTHRRGAADIIWFASNNNDKKASRLYQVFDDGVERSEVFTFGEGRFQDSQPTLSPDGAEVAFVSDRSRKRQIYRMPADGSEPPVQLTDNPTGAFEPAWSPDGDYIAFSAYEGGFSQIWVLNVKTGLKENVSLPGNHEGSPQWSPDSRSLIFVSTDKVTRSSKIAVMTREGSSRRYLVEGSGWNNAPSISPDGSKVAFMSNRDGDPEIFVVPFQGGKAHQLTSNQAYDTYPRWSPSGKRILFWSQRDGSAELYLMEADGQRQRPVIRKTSPPERNIFERDPCWLPAST